MVLQCSTPPHLEGIPDDAYQLDEMAEGAQSLWLKASIYKEEGAMKIWYEGDDTWDQTASIYIDPAGQTIWLCGWLPWYFGYKPENLWISTA